MARLAVKIGSLELKNPVLTASGSFGYGLEFEGVLDLRAIGGIVLKSITVEPRSGNPPPRIVETACGMLNSIGLENPGLEAFLRDVLPRVSRLAVPVIASIAGETTGEFETLGRALDGAPGVDALEVNVSCPNQAAGGMVFGLDPELAAGVVSKVRKSFSRTLIVKLTPNASDAAAVAAAVVAAGADAVSLVNTFLGLAVDWRRRLPAVHGIKGRGGLSGPAIKPLALRFVNDAFNAVKVPVIGIGGIMTADDAMEFIVAGASAVQVGTANFVDPRSPQIIAENLARLLDETGEPDVQNWIGSLNLHPRHGEAE